MIRGFLKAVAAGTVAGTAVPAIIFAIIFLGSSPSAFDIPSGMRIASVVVLIPFSLVIVSALIFGIPLTILLRRKDWESEAAYMASGAIIGFLVPGAVLVISEGDPSIFFKALLFSTLGAFSGGVTGRSWWRNYREEAFDG